PWYSRWSRQPRRGEPFAAAVARSLRADPAYLHATNELTRYLDAALRHAYRQRQLGDPALRWLLRQLVVVLRPLMGERAAMERVAELVVRRGLLHQRLGAEHGD
ncbi:MAG TPA: hypothetical protein VJT31_33825, partial [Rugosimonospora sp.]|nr:hypothetical protein [Rugosimonospora sp.]